MGRNGRHGARHMGRTDVESWVDSRPALRNAIYLLELASSVIGVAQVAMDLVDLVPQLVDALVRLLGQ